MKPRSRRLVVAAAVFAAVSALAAVLSVLPPTRANETGMSFTASNGLTGEYDVYAEGLARELPLCAVFVFHGDGAYEFYHPTSSYSLGGPTGIIAAAHAHGCITVSLLSPDGSDTWWQNGTANARYFHDLLSKLTSEDNVDSSRIWLVGYSGGAQFITQFYLPRYSSQIDAGGAIMFGGGGRPDSVDPPDFPSSLTANFPMFWYTGADDDGTTSPDEYNAIRDAKRGEAFYQDQGFNTSHEYPPDTAHDLDGRFGTVLDQQLKQWNDESTDE